LNDLYRRPVPDVAYRDLGPAPRRAALPATEDHLIEFVIIIAVLSWMGGFALTAAQAAARLDRVAPIWFVLGAILGPIALLLLQAAPLGRCPSCGTPTRGWLKLCWWCGENVTATPVETMAQSPKPPTLRRGHVSAPRRDQATATRLIQRARSAAPRSTPTQLARHVEPPSRPAATVASSGDAARLRLDGRRAAIGRKGTRASEPAGRIEPVPVETRVLTSAVYVTGSSSLESGRRYIIAIQGPRLRVLGPVDIDPSAVALDQALAEIDATSIEGRLVVSGPGGRSGTVLVFMSIAGTTPDIVATAIIEAARTVAQA
jgi:hypothetical protein